MNIVLYTTEDGKARFHLQEFNEQLWLTQADMAALYQITPQAVTQHIKAIYLEGELSEEATCKHHLQVQQEGEREVQRKRKHYALPMIIAVGYRVRSTRGTQFRQWATERLSEYLIKGITMDDERLKGAGGGHYWKELLERIRDIRSSEEKANPSARFTIPHSPFPPQPHTPRRHGDGGFPDGRFRCCIR